ncbi:MAG: hypothetical protein U9N73_08290 [Candidatus Auribacterota bacterium]|nr:hypothetical protein [Candidatus Auribacterota bacterium]
MKTQPCKITFTVLILPLLLIFFGPLPLLQGGSVSRGMTEQMQAGQKGSTGGGAPPGPFGDHWVHLQNNAIVDSYDSRVGDYSVSKGMDANVGCNVSPADAAAGISMDNNAIVRGDVSVTTSEGTGDIILMNNSVITGSPN